jgi:hypothetical protein
MSWRCTRYTEVKEAVCILDLSTRWRQVASIMLHLFYPHRKNSSIHWIGDTGPQNWSENGEEKNPCTCQESNPSHAAYSQPFYWLRYTSSFDLQWNPHLIFLSLMFSLIYCWIYKIPNSLVLNLIPRFYNVIVLLHIWEVLSSIYVNYCEWRLHGFPQSLQVNCGIVPLSRSHSALPLPS